MASLKFKPYVPVPQRPRKLKHTAPAPKRHHQDFTLPDCRGEDQLSQSVAESFFEMNDQEDMTLDLTGLDWSDDMQSVLQLMNRGCASSTDGKDVHEHPSNSSRHAPQPARPAKATEAIQRDGQNQGSVIVVEEDERAAEVDEMPSTLINSNSPAAILDPTAEEQVTDGAKEQSGLAHSRDDVATQSPDLSKQGIVHDTTRRDASLLPPVLSAPAPADADVKSPSPENLLDDETGFQRWLEAGQLQDAAPISKRTKRLLGDGQDGRGTDDQREAKRPRLSSTAECGTLLRQPGVCNFASTLVENAVDAQNRLRRRSSTRHVKDRNDNNGSDDNHCADNRLAMHAHARHPTHSLHSATAQYGGPISPPASIRSDIAVFSSGRSSKQPAPHLYRDTMKSHPPRAGAWRSPRASLPPVVPFSGAQEMGQAGQCKSCTIFRAALFEALSLLQSPLTEDISSNEWHDQPVSNALKRRYSLRRRSTVPESGCKETSNDDSLSCMDDHCSLGEDNGISASDDDDSLSVKGGSRNVCVKRRRWSPLEERRLRAWKRENKSESWIASKLNRTASAVKQQWRKMSEE